jgi:hypothetical protein
MPQLIDHECKCQNGHLLWLSEGCRRFHIAWTLNQKSSVCRGVWYIGQSGVHELVLFIWREGRSCVNYFIES